MINKSEELKNLASALCEFMKEVKNPHNTAKNPFFNSKYAPLNEILNDIRPLLAKHGLSIIQSAGGDGDTITIKTMILHKSGEWIELEPLVIALDEQKGRSKAQAAGSTITYGRRYALSAALGISSEDDTDGNLEESDEQPKKQKKTKQEKINWARFWAKMKELELNDEEVHALASSIAGKEIKSLKDVIKTQKSLDNLQAKIIKKLEKH